MSKKQIPAIFAPWITPAEQADVMRSDMWLPALKIHAKSADANLHNGEKLIITEVVYSEPRLSTAYSALVFGLQNGLRIIRMDKRSDGTWMLCAYDSPDSNGRSSMGTSKKPMYLINRMFKDDTSANLDYHRVSEKAANWLNKVLYYFANEIVGDLRRSHRTDTDYKAMLPQDAVRSLVRLFNNEITVHDMSAGERSACERAAKLIATSTDNVSHITNTLRDAFNRERWVLGYMNGSGSTGNNGFYLLAAVNTSALAKDWCDHVQGIGSVTYSKQLYTPIKQLTCYRNFNDIPEEIRNDLMPSLLMANVSFKSKQPDIGYRDFDKYVINGDAISYDMNAYAYCMGGQSAMWVTVEKKE